ncbi:hypothetical protein MPH_03826 [Macrophomina phaseolina MS6]|uniref:Six-hairpin glycosidase-like protein n=1 Tax=Macrophomina phaseolina (strain MS6) TaxID=1126212 RepID=K2S1T4_MACPH|nr:hypothetical protein MPH_03826 [Macrophomina phaseolina MS6]
MWVVSVALLLATALAQQCPDYSSYSQQRHEPFSHGAFNLSYQRPAPSCRTFNSSAVEDVIGRMQSVIIDPDLFRLFENAYPNTLDTAIKWKGFAANNSEEDLCFIITGDINAMWIRDSANQLQSYRSILNSSSDDIASLYRGVINLQARYLNTSPYCNSFLAPPESPIPPDINGAIYNVRPPYDNRIVFTCNFELDSFAALLQISHDYHTATNDTAFFGKFQWIPAVQTILTVARDMMSPTYAPDGSALDSSYTFQSNTNTATGTLNNFGLGNPVNRTGLIRSPFRPSDDASLFQFLIPSNMMFARYLSAGASIMSALPSAPPGLAQEMVDMAASLRDAVDRYAIVPSPRGSGGQIYAFEIDGYGGRNLMDDANIPSLLSLPFFGYLDRADPIYRNTRDFVLSEANPWFSRGPVISAVGSPHIRPGTAWPMSSIVRILTTDDEAEIVAQLREILGSTDGLGLVHESVNSSDEGQWTRQWFSWANGLFGQMILELEASKPDILARSFQPRFIRTP